MKVKSESEVAQSCPTPSNPMDCSLPGSSVHGIFQARVLVWGAIAFSILHLHLGVISLEGEREGNRHGGQGSPNGGNRLQVPDIFISLKWQEETN